MGAGWNWLRIVSSGGHIGGVTWSKPITLRWNLMLFSHLCLGIRSHDVFHAGFPTKTLYAHTVSAMCVTCPSISYYLIFHLGGVYKLKIVFVQVGWSSDDAHEFCLEGVRFESRLVHCSYWLRFSCFSSIPAGIFWGNAWNQATTASSPFFSFHYISSHSLVYNMGLWPQC
jgi:hypothetical protein